MSFDRMKYQINVYAADGRIMDLSKYFMGGEINETLDDPSNARLEFMDKYGVIEEALGYTGTFPIEMRIRTASAGNFVRVFIGEVENVDITIGPEGEKKTSFNAFGAPDFRYGYLSPNQVMIGNCDFGALFTGSPTLTYARNNVTWSATWSADSAGNYPNGLLYDTGFSFSALSIADAFPSISDVPIQVRSGAYKKLDYIKEILSPYDFHFYLDEGCFTTASNSTERFRLLGHPDTDWDSCSWYSFSLGRNVNKMEKRFRLADYSDKIIVVSRNTPSIFAIEGEGNNEFFYDGEADDFDTARKLSLQQYEIRRTIPKTLNITALPTPNKNPSASDASEDYLMGKIIPIVYTDSSYENAVVYGITQRFDVDRWTTDFILSRDRPTEVKIFNEIRDDIKRLNDEGIGGKAYIKVSVPTGSELSYGMTTYNYDYYPCAIGLGTSSDTSTHSNGFGGKSLPPDSYFAAPIAIQPLKALVINNISSTDVDSITTSLWAEFTGNRCVGLVKELVVFANNNLSGSLYNVTQSMNFGVGYGTEYFMTSSNERTYSGYIRGFWPIELTRVGLKSRYSSASAYGWKAKDASIAKEVWWTADITASPTESTTPNYWNSGTSISGSDLKNMSIWTNDTDSSYSTHILNSAAPYIPQILLEFSIPVPFAKLFAKGLKANFSAINHIYTPSGWTNCSYSVNIWNCATNAWDILGLAGTFSQTNSTELVRHQESIWESPLQTISSFIDEKGITRFKITGLSHSSYPTNATYSLEMNYFDLVYDWMTHYDHGNVETGTEKPTIIEIVPFDVHRESFKLSFQPTEILGVWFDGSYDGWTYVPSGTNYVTRFSSRDLTMGSQEVFTAYRQDFTISVRDTVNFGRGTVNAPGNNEEIGYKEGWKNVFDDDLEIKLKLFNQGWAIFSYSTNQNLSITPNDYKDACRIVWDTASAGSRSNFIVKLNGAPPLETNIFVEYTAVGPEIPETYQEEYLRYRGVIAGRAVMATDSAIREGLNKTQNVAFEIQARVNGLYYPDISTPTNTSSYSGMGAMSPAGDRGTEWLERKLRRLDLLY